MSKVLNVHWNNCDTCGRETIHDSRETCIRYRTQNEPNNYYDKNGEKVTD